MRTPDQGEVDSFIRHDYTAMAAFLVGRNLLAFPNKRELLFFRKLSH